MDSEMNDEVSVLMRKIADQKAQEKERIDGERKELRRRLLTAGIERVEAEYDGYADSGCVGDIVTTPECPLGDLEQALVEFVWGFAYDRHPGFENNEGGEGMLNWDVIEDTISLDHANRYVELDWTCEEGL